MSNKFLDSTGVSDLVNEIANQVSNKYATKAIATQSANGLMSSSDKVKLDGIATGANKTVVDTALSSTSTNPVQNKVINSALAGKAASSHTHSSYVNQNAFSNITVGSTTVSADSATDTLTLVAGSNITITPDATNDKVTIASTNTWRGIQNNLTSNSTTDSLSAAQGKVLKGLVDSKAASSHTHTKSQITDFPSSLPANGGTAHEVLTPSSKAHLYEDGEGGNLSLCAPDGIHFMEMDLYNNEGFRMYFGDRTKDELYFPVSYNFNTGKFNINGDADTVDGVHASDFAYMTDIVRGLKCGYASANTGTIMTYGDRTVVKTSNKLSYFGWTINSDGWFAPIIVSRSASGTNYTMWDQNCGYDSAAESDRATFEYKNRTYYACWSSPGSYLSPAVTGGLHLTVTNNDYVAACKTLIDICESTTVDEIISNPNLLINPDFKINQRGMTDFSISYHQGMPISQSQVYTVDRWRIMDGKANISNGKFVLNGTIIQVLENSIGSDFTATVSVESGTATASYDDSTKTFTIVGTNAVLNWAKLEYGSIATPFIPPDPTTELIKCQRFYYKSNRDTYFGTGYCVSTGGACIMLPLFMRIDPTVSYIGVQLMTIDDHVNPRSINSITVKRCNSGIRASVSVTNSTLTVGNGVMFFQNAPENAGYFALDAEIY